jgi:primosomal protein N' (replication factor Y)
VSICVSCGVKRKCKHCDTSVVYHKESNVLICHQCGRKELLDGKCTKCQSSKFILVGVGIEKIYEEVSKIFKSAKIIKLSSDSMDRENFAKTLEQIEQSKVDIIIGTQIISKGFDFKNLKSVFIIDFDMWFNNADIRTNEKVFQLTQQVAGRAGRRAERGEVFIQTYEPKHNLLNDIIKNNRDLFYEKELKIRKKSILPPFSKLLLITISSQDIKLAEEKAKNIQRLFDSILNLTVLGPIPAQIFYVNKQYRFRLLIKSTNPLTIQKYLISNKFSFNIGSKVKIKLDFDPYNLY